MSEKVYGCNLCRPKKFFLGEEKYLEHQKLHSDKYLCDYICNCPATSVAERVERETIEAILKAVEGLDKYAIDGECDGLGDHVYFGKLTPNERKIDDDYDASLVHYLMKSEVISAIRKALK